MDHHQVTTAYCTQPEEDRCCGCNHGFHRVEPCLNIHLDVSLARSLCMRCFPLWQSLSWEDVASLGATYYKLQRLNLLICQASKRMDAASSVARSGVRRERGSGRPGTARRLSPLRQGAGRNGMHSLAYLT
jgi:hypothetical protein